MTGHQSPVVCDGYGAVLTLAGPGGGSPVRILCLVCQAPVVVPVHPLVVPVGAASVTAIASHPVGTVQHVLLAQVGRENTGRLVHARLYRGDGGENGTGSAAALVLGRGDPSHGGEVHGGGEGRTETSHRRQQF